MKKLGFAVFILLALVPQYGMAASAEANEMVERYAAIAANLDDDSSAMAGQILNPDASDAAGNVHDGVVITYRKIKPGHNL